MATKTPNRSVTVLRVPALILRRVRRSFLLMAATFGLLMTLFAGVIVAPLGHDILAGIIGASGLSLFFFNIVWYGVYKVAERYFEQDQAELE